MNSAIERLLSLRVADVMQRRVLALWAEDTMAQAGEKLLGNCHSGAPVVDRQGSCVGVLSAVDFVKRGVQNGHQDHSLSDPAERVETYMTADVCSIDSDATLIDAAREMCRRHVHRLPVVDKQRRLSGMLSSLDVVAAVVHAVEE